MPKKRTLKEDELAQYSIPYVLLIAFAVISLWRGVWGFMDEFLFPGNMALSLSLSVFIGVGILVVTKHARRELI